MSTTQLKAKIAETTDKAKDAAVTAIDAAKEAGRTAREEVTTRASETLETVREVAADRAEAARETLIDSGDRLAQTLQDHAAEAPAVQARVLTGIAGGVTKASDALRGRTVGELVSTAQDYARRHPGAFAAGAAVAGFALARFLRSSSRASAAAARAVEETSRIYHNAAQRSVDTLGKAGENHGTGRPS
jgi:vacuolar-type H+-ATPase subunit H